MKMFFKAKDGGKDSFVTGYWLIECKSLFSIVLLRFDPGSREVYHNHAFNALSWVISGSIEEHTLHSWVPNIHLGSLIPIYTSRTTFHKVYGKAEKTWIISFRGPWSKTWKEYDDKYTVLASGRVQVE